MGKITPDTEASATVGGATRHVEDAQSSNLAHNAAQAKISDGDTTNYDEKARTKTKFSHYTRIFTYSTLADRVLLLIATICQISIGATLPLMIVVFGNLVGQFSEYFVPGSGVTRAEFDKALNKLTLYIVYLFVARWLLGYFSMFAFRVVSLKISAKIRLEYLKALFSLPVYILDTFPSGQASNTLTTTSNVMQNGISDKLALFFQFQSMLVTAIVIAFKFSWSLTLVTSSLLVFIVAVYGTLVPIIIKMTKEVKFADEKASSIAGEVMGSTRMIAACGASDKIVKKYSGWVDESRKRGLKISIWQGLQFSPVYFAIYATMALAFWFGFKLYRQGNISSVGTIVIVLESVMMVSISVGQASAPIIAMSKAASAASDFFAVIDAPKPSTTGLKSPQVSAQYDLRFESVDFAYPGRPHIKVLHDLNICFESGKLTAIVGASGSGKSTIVGLLERWYDLRTQDIKIPESALKGDKPGKSTNSKPEIVKESLPPVELRGTIRLGGHNIEKLDLRWWRSQVGLVQQEPFIFNDTIAKNVEHGLIGSEWEESDAATKRQLVEQACQEAYASEFIDKLPLGYESQVGDSGIKLSGGQRQRLAIARSIIKRPKILILDEATSSIDVRGERLVQAALDRASEGRTTITVAHRLSTIKKADKIIVMKKGHVVEQGTHDELLNNHESAYFALVDAQQLSMDESILEELSIEPALSGLKQTEAAVNSTDEETLTASELAYKPRGVIGSFGLLFFEQRNIWQWYGILLVGCVGTGLAFPLQAYLFAQIMVVITETGRQLIDAVNYWSLMFFILAIGISVAYFIVGWSSNNVSVVSCPWREYFESILAKPVKFFDADDHSSGTLTALVANDPTQLQELLGLNMSLVLSAVFSLTGCVIIAFVFGWKLTLVAFFVAIPIIMGGSYVRVRYELQFEKLNQAVFAESSKFAAESIGAFRTVASLTLEDMICKRYDLLLADHVKKASRKATYASLIFSASDSVSLLCMGLTLWYGGRLLASHEYGPIEFFVVYIAVINGSQNAGSFLSFGPNMAQATAAANRILGFRVCDKESTKIASELQDTEGGIKIELNDIWFKYPTRDVPIFTGLDLRIEKGQFAALVGSSGCGKTSVVSLLERFYDVQRGQILCNGSNIAELDVVEYRKALSLVAQEPTLFQGTIKQNVLLGVSESTPDERLFQACRDAEIHDFIESLPDGYNTDIGTKGVTLSGGQKQRLSIARALIRDPKILLLDEATSSLDSESEKLVQAAFERAATGRTMLVVAHRLATVQNADVIFVLGEGKVLEKGNHSTLLSKRGLYYQMCQSQALDR